MEEVRASETPAYSETTRRYIPEEFIFILDAVRS
jgi:hypothetical protein